MLAAMLLSIGAFAQSNESLEGDVNNDGVVDVADIVKIIDIMQNSEPQEVTYYFSVGITPVTSDNYTTVNNATTDIPTTTTYASQQRNYHYILAPDNKTVTVVNNANNNEIPITEQTDINISGHNVYKTNGPLSVGGVVRITLNDVR